MKASAKRQIRNFYKYDVALSFAGEDREYAKSLSSLLKERGYSVFYDADQQANLWGKTAKAFELAYGPHSRYVIPIVSKHYVRKDWTRHEFETAKREQAKRRGEFILPVRLDDSRLLGLSDEVIKLDARQIPIDQIAQLFSKKRRPMAGQVRRRPIQGMSDVTLRLFKSSSRRALGLIATAAIPLPRNYYEKLFPNYDWRRLVASFRRVGLMQPDGPFLRPKNRVLKLIRTDVEDRKELNQIWIHRLSPLKDHVDTAALLSLHFFKAHRYEDAARVIIDAEASTNLGWWASGYLAILRALSRRRYFKTLLVTTQVRLLNSLGACLAHAGLYSDALRKYDQLRRFSRLQKNSWGVGQSLINAGVAAYRSGNPIVAEKLYTQAVDHAKRSRNQMLRGRALSNLAQLLQDTDIIRAESLLDESLKAKAAAEDFSGLLAGSIIRGNLAAARGHFALAARWYKQSSHNAKRLGLRYEHALSTYNLGSALRDLGRKSDAIRLYAKARDLASRDSYTDILELSLNALGANAFMSGQFASAHVFALELLKTAKKTKNQEYELAALHMLAASSLARHRKSDSSREFRAALSAARGYDAVNWVVRCLIDATRCDAKSGLSAPNAVRLRQIANIETADGHFNVAAQIWAIVAQMDAAHDAVKNASNAFMAVDKCLSRVSNSVLKRLENYRNWIGWAWQVRQPKESFNVLRKLESLARRTGNKADQIAALDQRGVYLQQLGMHAEAEAIHREAIKGAEHIGDDGQLEGSLNNLGEALRHLDRHDEALIALRASEAIARRAKRYNSAIATTNNLALGLTAIGKYDEAEELVRSSRDESARRRLWREYVQSWENLANIVWEAGKPVRALTYYHRALQEAKRRNLYDLQPRIALNFARLLRIQGKLEKALATLEKFRGQLDGFVLDFQYFGDLAELYMAKDRMRDATETWDIAKSRADALGNKKFSSYCILRKAVALAKLGRLKHSRSTIVNAIKSERDPSRHADLLVQQLELLLERKSSRLAQEAFNDALHFCIEHKLNDQKAELYFLIGDHDLNGPYDKKFNAFKAYTMAMVGVAETDLDKWGEIASRIVLKVASSRSPLTESEIGRLLFDLENSMLAGAPHAKRAIKFFLWPFEVAAKTFAFRKNPSRFAAAVEKLTGPDAMKNYLSTVTDVATPQPVAAQSS